LDEIQDGEFTGFLGFQLNNTGGTSNYGWLSLTMNNRGEGSINSFAFNDVAGQSIKTGQTKLADTVKVPEPGTLALMVMGAGALLARRRKSLIR